MKLEFDLENLLAIGSQIAKTVTENDIARESLRDSRHQRQMEKRKLRQELKLKRIEMKINRKNNK